MKTKAKTGTSENHLNIIPVEEDHNFSDEDFVRLGGYEEDEHNLLFVLPPNIDVEVVDVEERRQEDETR